jgi:hypothetical protein
LSWGQTENAEPEKGIRWVLEISVDGKMRVRVYSLITLNIFLNSSLNGNRLNWTQDM